MPITGSQKALMQARAGIALSGATRAGYYVPNVIITINGTDRTSSVIIESLGVDLNLNDEPDECVFQLKPNPGFTPTAGQSVVVGLGTVANKVFAGQIVSIAHRREKNQVATRSWMTIRCTDWNRLFDRRLITKRYTAMSGTAIALDIVSAYTSGFTAARIERGLAIVDEFVLINEQPTAALRRLAGLVDGFFYIDPDKVVHFWVTADPYQSSPQPLTETTATLQAFDLEYDYSQIRTQVIAEGRSQQVMIDVPAGETSIPVEYGWGIATNGTPNPPLTPYVRIGTHVLLYGSVTHILGPPASMVTADAAVGATSVSITSSTGWSSSGWAHDAGGNLFKYSSVGASALNGIPSSGYGSITNAIELDTPVYEQDTLILSVTLPEAISRGDLVTYRLVVDDTSAQTAIAAIEGGDGIHQYLITDDSWEAGGIVSAEEAIAVAGLSEIQAFGEAVRRARWVTRDLAATVGRSQVFNFTNPAYSDTLTILRVSLRWYKQNHRPVRTCQASTVKVASVLETLARFKGEQ